MKTMRAGLTGVAGVLAAGLLTAAAGAQCLSGAGWTAGAKKMGWTASTNGVRMVRAGYQPAAGNDINDLFASIVGMWHVKLVAVTVSANSGLPFGPGDVADAGYQQWHNDGTEMLNSGARPPVISSFCMGVWEQTGPRMFKLNHFAISWVPGASTATGPTSIVEEVTVAPNGKTFSGTFTLTDYVETHGATGDTIAVHDTVTGTITGTRIDVNTPAEPIF